MAIPKEIDSIKNFILESNLALSSNFSDGRINASINEAEVLELLRKNFIIEIPKSRAWYDFMIQKEGKFCLSISK
jgi:hypothetical protein